MRRPQEVGLVVLLMLGASGCAGFQQRPYWSSATTAGPDGADAPTPPPSPFSFWRRSGSEAAPHSESAPSLAETPRPAVPVGATSPSGDVWPESRQEWTARNFPRLTFLFTGYISSGAPDGGAPNLSYQPNRISPRQSPSTAPATASTPRDDDEVRPTDGSSEDNAASSKARAVDRPRARKQPPRPSSLRDENAPRHSLPEPKGDVELDISSSGTGRDLQPTQDEAEPRPEASRQPEEASPSPALADRAAAESGSDEEQPGTKSRSESAPLRAAATAGTADLLVKAPNDESVYGTSPAPSTDAGTTLAGSSAPSPPAEQDTRMAQVPPAPPLPARRTTPPAPAAPGGESPAVTTSPPAAPTVPTEEAAAPQPAPAAAPPAAAAPAPVATASQAPPATSGQKLLATSPQSIYASPPPIAPPEPRRKFLSWLHHESKAEPLASPQLPPATFPTGYRLNCENVKPAPATPAGESAPCSTTHKAAKKPCVLSAWIGKLKSWGHGSDCGSCQHVRPATCCQGCHCCHCCQSKNQAVSASPQANAGALPGKTASAQRGTLYLAAEPVGSRGTETGDVSQGGQVAGATVSQVVDKSPEH
jgi:hypothetical protein